MKPDNDNDDDDDDDEWWLVKAIFTGLALSIAGALAIYYSLVWFIKG